MSAPTTIRVADSHDQAHREVPRHVGPAGFVVNTACDMWVHTADAERLPLPVVDPDDRCPTCWPNSQPDSQKV